MRFRRFSPAKIIGLLVLLLLPKGVAAQEQSFEDSLFITVRNPITSDVCNQIKKTTERARDRLRKSLDGVVLKKGQGSPRLKIVYDFNPDGQPANSVDFWPCHDLAHYLLALHGVTTIAFVHNDTTGHTVLPVLACNELVMASGKEVRLGNILPDPADQPPDEVVQVYSGLARRRGRCPAIVLKMLDKNLVVIEGIKKGAVWYVDRRRLETEMKDGFVPVQGGPVLPGGATGFYTALQASKFGFCNGIRDTRREVANAYQMTPASLQEVPDQKPVPQDDRPGDMESATAVVAHSSVGTESDHVSTKSAASFPHWFIAAIGLVTVAAIGLNVWLYRLRKRILFMFSLGMTVLLGAVALWGLSHPRQAHTHDALDPLQIPAGERYSWQPKELVAVIGSHRSRDWGSTNAIAFSPDGTSIASGGWDSCVRIWDMNGRETAALKLPDGSMVNALTFSPDGRLLLAGDEFGNVHVWDLHAKPPKVLPPLKPAPLPDSFPPAVDCIAFAPGGKRLACSVGRQDKVRVALWDSTTWPPRELPDLPEASGPFAFGADGKTLVTEQGRGGILTWDLTGEQPKKKAAGTSSACGNDMRILVVAPDGKTAATCYDRRGEFPTGEPKSAMPQ